MQFLTMNPLCASILHLSKALALVHSVLAIEVFALQELTPEKEIGARSIVQNEELVVQLLHEFLH